MAATDLLVSLLGLENSEMSEKGDTRIAGSSGMWWFGENIFFPLCWLKQGGGIAEVNILYCLCKLPLENTSPRCFLDVFVVNELPIPFSVARRQGSADTSFRPLFCISSVSLFFWFVSGFVVSSG